jgi:hypothetical protein
MTHCRLGGTIYAGPAQRGKSVPRGTADLANSQWQSSRRLDKGLPPLWQAKNQSRAHWVLMRIHLCARSMRITHAHPQRASTVRMDHAHDRPAQGSPPPPAVAAVVPPEPKPDANAPEPGLRAIPASYQPAAWERPKRPGAESAVPIHVGPAPAGNRAQLES